MLQVSLQRVAGIALIASFVFSILGFVMGPPGVSRAPDIDAALQAIRDRQVLYVLSNLISALAVLLPAIGFVLLALHLRGTRDSQGIGLGTAVLVIGAVAGLIHTFRITMDPTPYLATTIERATPPMLFTVFGFTSLAGAFLIGIAFLQSALPKGLGYALAGHAVIATAVVLVAGIPVFPAVMLLYPFLLAVGIVLVGRPVIA